MSQQEIDFTIIGGGIVGLSTAMNLGNRYPKARLVVLEKEDSWAAHQSGHNSGVIHSGIYYHPGSFKARFTREGNRNLVQFCQEHGIEYEACGKVIVATEEQEIPLLEKLYKRGLENSLNVSKLGTEQVKEIETHVRCLAGILVPTAGIVDYKQVCQKYVEIVEFQGGELHLNTKVEKILQTSQGQILSTNRGNLTTKFT